MGRRRRWRGEIRSEWNGSRIWSIFATIVVAAGMGYCYVTNDQHAERSCRWLYSRAHTAADSLRVDDEVFSRRGEPRLTCRMLVHRTAAGPGR